MLWCQEALLQGADSCGRLAPYSRCGHIRGLRKLLNWRLHDIVDSAENTTKTGDHGGRLHDHAESLLEALAKVIPEVEVLNLTILHGVEHHELLGGELTPLGLGEVLELVPLALYVSLSPQILGVGDLVLRPVLDLGLEFVPLGLSLSESVLTPLLHLRGDSVPLVHEVVNTLVHVGANFLEGEEFLRSNHHSK